MAKRWRVIKFMIVDEKGEHYDETCGSLTRKLIERVPQFVEESAQQQALIDELVGVLKKIDDNQFCSKVDVRKALAKATCEEKGGG